MVKKRGLGRRGAEGTFWVIISAILAVAVLVILFLFFTGSGGTLLDRFNDAISTVITHGATALQISEKSFKRIVGDTKRLQQIEDKTFEVTANAKCDINDRSVTVNEYKGYIEDFGGEVYTEEYGDIADRVPEARYYLGKCYQGYSQKDEKNEKCDRPKEAISSFNEVRERDTKYYVDSLLRKGKCEEVDGNRDMAKELYKEAIAEAKKLDMDLKRRQAEALLASIEEEVKETPEEKEKRETTAEFGIPGGFNRDYNEIAIPFWESYPFKSKAGLGDNLNKVNNFLSSYSEDSSKFEGGIEHYNYLTRVSSLFKRGIYTARYYRAVLSYELGKHEEAKTLFMELQRINADIEILVQENYATPKQHGEIAAWSYYYLAQIIGRGDSEEYSDILTQLFIEFSNSEASDEAYKDLRERDCVAKSGSAFNDINNCVNLNDMFNLDDIYYEVGGDIRRSDVPEKFKEIRCFIDKEKKAPAFVHSCVSCKSFDYTKGCSFYKDRATGGWEGEKIICEKNPCGVPGGCVWTSMPLVRIFTSCSPK